MSISKPRFGSVTLFNVRTLRLFNDNIVVTVSCLFNYQHFFSCTIVLALMILAHSFPCWVAVSQMQEATALIHFGWLLPDKLLPILFLCVLHTALPVTRNAAGTKHHQLLHFSILRHLLNPRTHIGELKMSTSLFACVTRIGTIIFNVKVALEVEHLLEGHLILAHECASNSFFHWGLVIVQHLSVVERNNYCWWSLCWHLTNKIYIC